jgi:hypothetical protein
MYWLIVLASALNDGLVACTGCRTTGGVLAAEGGAGGFIE